MSSEALPLIFEPLEDTASERAPPDTASAVTLAPGSLQPPADIDGPPRAPTPQIPDWTSPWQTSGTEQLDPTASPGPPASPQPAGGDQRRAVLQHVAVIFAPGSKLHKSPHS